MQPVLKTPNPFGYQRRDGNDIAPNRVTPVPEAPTGAVSGLGAAEEASAQDAAELAKHQEKTRWQNYASLMCGGNLPITGVGATILGSDLDTANRYRVAFKNTLGRVIAVKVVGDFGVALGAADLSFSQELSNQNLVDRLSASGTVVTANILMAPEQILYIRNSDPTLIITLAGATFRVLLLDPASVFGERILP